MVPKIIFLPAILLAGVLLTQCTKPVTPKPMGYNRLILPDTAYLLSPDTLPFQFEYSKYARLYKDTSAIKEKNWVEIHYPTLKSTIHVTYKDLNHDEKLFKEFMTDAYTLTAKHQIKAYAINEIIETTPTGKVAIIAELEGDVPSQFQVTVTDSTQHFLRAALYFNTKVANDSLDPAIRFMKQEVRHLINSLRWKSEMK